jgi:hypothetical protein
MDLDQLRDALQFDNGRLWLLIGLGLATIYTLQAVEEAVEGAWPHLRRPARLPRQARAVNAAWPWVALLVLPGLLLGILNVAILLWKDLPRSETQALGSLFVGAGWVVFVLASSDRFRFGRYLGQLGLVGPASLIVLLLIGNTLLTIGLFDVLPPMEEVRDALPIV